MNKEERDSNTNCSLASWLHYTNTDCRVTNMAYANQMAVAYNGYNGVVNVSGGASLYPTHANSGSVKVDQIKPIVLGQINSFLCKYYLYILI